MQTKHRLNPYMYEHPNPIYSVSYTSIQKILITLLSFKKHPQCYFNFTNKFVVAVNKSPLEYDALYYLKGYGCYIYFGIPFPHRGIQKMHVDFKKIIEYECDNLITIDKIIEIVISLC